LVGPIDVPEGTKSAISADPAVGGGIGGGAVVDEGEAIRVEIERTHAGIERTRAEIERTRADMSETVDAIQERLSPENLKEQAKDRVKEATVGRAQEAGSGIAGTIRANPLPAALTGIGLGWLLVSARRQSEGRMRYQDRRYAYDHGYPPAHDYPPRYEDEGASGTSAGQAVERARDSIGESATQAQDKAGQVASQAQDKVGQVASQTQDRVGRLGEQARYQAQRASGGFQRMLRENPLAMGALGVGVGAAVGLAIPATAKEHEVMGEARDTFVEKAQEKAQDVQQRVQQVAQEAQGAAQQEANNQGLTNQ
jgi:ElaB/YqjD/DUF883 family membrane-anchored ribosome-binding protein